MRVSVTIIGVLLGTLLGLVDMQLIQPFRQIRRPSDNSRENDNPSNKRFIVRLPQDYSQVVSGSAQRPFFLPQLIRQKENRQSGQVSTVIRQPNFTPTGNSQISFTAPQPQRLQQFGNGQGISFAQSNFQPSINSQLGLVTQQPNRQQQTGNNGFSGTLETARREQMESVQVIPPQVNPSLHPLSSQAFVGTLSPSRQQTELAPGITGITQPSREQTGIGQGFQGTQQPDREQTGVGQGFQGTHQPLPHQAGGSSQSLLGGSPGSEPAAGHADRHHLCLVRPEPGECRGAFPRYFYDPESDQCDCFVYGGCGLEGLQPNFKSLKDCQRSCLPTNLQEGPKCRIIFSDEQTVFTHKAHASPPFQSHASANKFLSMIIQQGSQPLN
ncbi:hypothetical protein OTU49_006653 [Cherax quadricarinatus]|uniref:BPTI/Kunitz inhibitor domain-containing protein n=3 Tax=Cherax quadricarinatus TaxID=27406 RepID=A0AAW0WPZ0_CHEQU|nr:uncharacterized protein LOC128699008 [Cherax quadricarinatus]